MRYLIYAAAAYLVWKFWLKPQQPAAAPPARTNADKVYDRYGNQAPATVTAANNLSASGIGSSDYYTKTDGSAYVTKVSSGYQYPNKPMVDDKNTAAGVESLQFVDPFADESGM